MERQHQEMDRNGDSLKAAEAGKCATILLQRPMRCLDDHQ